MGPGEGGGVRFPSSWAQGPEMLQRSQLALTLLEPSLVPADFTRTTQHTAETTVKKVERWQCLEPWAQPPGVPPPRAPGPWDPTVMPPRTLPRLFESGRESGSATCPSGAVSQKARSVRGWQSGSCGGWPSSFSGGWFNPQCISLGQEVVTEHALTWHAGHPHRR